MIKVVKKRLPVLSRTSLEFFSQLVKLSFSSSYDLKSVHCQMIVIMIKRREDFLLCDFTEESMTSVSKTEVLTLHESTRYHRDLFLFRRNTESSLRYSRDV